MDAKEASEIVEAYKACISKGTEGETIFRRVSWLPYSKLKIKYAYCTLLEDTIKKKDRLTSDLKENLVTSYSLLNNFVDDNIVNKYAKIYQDWQSKKLDLNKSKKDERLIKQYLSYTYTLKGSDLFDEINEYIGELLKQVYIYI